MFGTSIRVHPMFWVFSAILGWQWLELGVEYVLLWIVCTFVSILVHEFGHVFAGRCLGRQDSYIILYSFGGLAANSTNLPRRWQRIIVCLAGPAAGLLLYGLVLLVSHYALPRMSPALISPMLLFAFIMLEWMNLAWSLLNLIPIWPLDGGQVSREVLGSLFRGRGIELSLGLSFVLAGLLAIHSILAANGKPLVPWLPIAGSFSAILFGLLAVESFQLLQQARSNQRHWQDDDTPWERDPTIWRR